MMNMARIYKLFDVHAALGQAIGQANMFLVWVLYLLK